jgi:hypothetical protein
MSHGLSDNWRYVVVALYMLFSMSMLPSRTPVRVNIYRRLKKEVVSHVIGMTPVALLLYALYIVSFKF